MQVTNLGVQASLPAQTGMVDVKHDEWAKEIDAAIEKATFGDVFDFKAYASAEGAFDGLTDEDAEHDSVDEDEDEDEAMQPEDAALVKVAASSAYLQAQEMAVKQSSTRQRIQRWICQVEDPEG